MGSISQIIRWRQGRALVSNRPPKPRPAAPPPAAAETSPSARVSLSGNATATTAATYADRLKRAAKAKNDSGAKPGNHLAAGDTRNPHAPEALELGSTANRGPTQTRSSNSQATAASDSSGGVEIAWDDVAAEPEPAPKPSPTQPTSTPAPPPEDKAPAPTPPPAA